MSLIFLKESSYCFSIFPSEFPNSVSFIVDHLTFILDPFLLLLVDHLEIAIVVKLVVIVEINDFLVIKGDNRSHFYRVQNRSGVKKRHFDVRGVRTTVVVSNQSRSYLVKTSQVKAIPEVRLSLV